MNAPEDRPWVGYEFSSKYKNALSGNRAGFIKLRDAIDEVLEKEAVDVSEITTDFGWLNVIEAAELKKKTRRPLKDWFALIVLAILGSFVTGSLYFGAPILLRYLCLLK